MKVLILTAISALALPLMAFGQTAEPQQAQDQVKEPAKETQATAAAKGKKTQSAQEQTTTNTKPEAGTDVQGKTKAHQGHAEGTTGSEAGTRSSTSQTNAKSGTHTTVNKQEFRSRHREVFTLGRHPKEFFIRRYGENHFHLIGNTYFVFVDTCWVAVDVEGFTFAEQVICPGDPDYIEVY